VESDAFDGVAINPNRLMKVNKLYDNRFDEQKKREKERFVETPVRFVLSAVYI
jgi:hypothetical protein